MKYYNVYKCNPIKAKLLFITFSQLCWPLTFTTVTVEQDTKGHMTCEEYLKCIPFLSISNTN